MNLSKVKIPTETQWVLNLIKEDLRFQKFFDDLRELGLDNAWYPARFGNTSPPTKQASIQQEIPRTIVTTNFTPDTTKLCKQTMRASRTMQLRCIVS